MATPGRLLIGGVWTEAATGGTFETIDPATGDPIATVARGGMADVERAVGAARAALTGPWTALPPAERARLLYAAARAITDDLDAFARLETRDNGKPLSQARVEVQGAARYFEYYAGAADKIHGQQIPLGPERVDFTIREPMGVTAHIIPWNKPLNILCRSLAPALAAGNTAVIKPSELTPLSALRLAELLLAIGFPSGVVNVVTGLGEEAGAALAGHPDIDHLTFTGSTATGRAVMMTAAEHLKPLVLALGGKSPLLVFADADLDHAVAETVRGLLTNCGQMCSAGSRVLLQEQVRDAFSRRLLAAMNGLRIGPGTEDPDVGPMVSALQLQRVMSHIEIARREGARLLLGGAPLSDRDGFFMAPTVFTDVLPDMHIAQQEVFGPVLSLLTFQDEEEALRIANQVPYGLVAGIFTQDVGRSLRLATRLRAGQVAVNAFYPGDEETPFGGFGQSGFGRLKGTAALDQYTQIKHVTVRW